MSHSHFVASDTSTYCVADIYCISNSDSMMVNNANILPEAQLAAVSGYANEMLPPICLEYRLDKRPVLTHCTFNLPSLRNEITKGWISAIKGQIMSMYSLEHGHSVDLC